MMDQRFRKGPASKVVSSAGFTIVELLVALLIFLIAVGSAFATFQASAQLTESARNRMVALQDATSVLEEIKTLNLQSIMTTLPAQLSSGQFNSKLRTFNSNETPTGQSVSALNSEQITLTSNPQIITGATTLATFTVTVSWQEVRGRQLSLSLTTQRSSY